MVYAEKMIFPKSSSAPSMLATARGCRSNAKLSCLPVLASLPSKALCSHQMCPVHASLDVLRKGWGVAVPFSPPASLLPPKGAAQPHTYSQSGLCTLNIGGSAHRYYQYILGALIKTYSSWLSLLPQVFFEDLICLLLPHCNLRHPSMSHPVPPPSVRPSLNPTRPLLCAFFSG